MNKLVVANLKSYLNDFNVENYAKNIREIKYDNLVICPQDKYIELIKSDNYKLGIQDYSDNYYKVEYVLLGHYDRRKNHETNELINEKIKKSLLNGLKVILCVGNNKEDNYEYIFRQIDICLKGIDKKNLHNVILAYEPFYMIGKDFDIDTHLIKEFINHIRKYTENNYCVKMNVLYGGNVNESNIDQIIKMSDGVLIGRASFDAEKLEKIVKKIEKNQ